MLNKKGFIILTLTLMTLSVAGCNNANQIETTEVIETKTLNTNAVDINTTNEQIINQKELLDDLLTAELYDQELKEANRGMGSDSIQEIGTALFMDVLNRKKEQSLTYWDKALDYDICKYTSNDTLDQMIKDTDDFLSVVVAYYDMKSLDDVEVIVYSTGEVENSTVALCQFKLYSKDFGGDYDSGYLLNSFFCHTAMTPDGEKWFLGNVTKRR